MKHLLTFGLIILTTIFAIAANPIKVNCVKVSGPIEEFSDNHVVVQGKSYTIHKDTEFENGSKADMAVGVWVTVEGENRSGILFADEIEFKEPGGGKDKVLKVGKISAVSGATFTVGGTKFTVNDDTDFENGTQSNLAVGRLVKVVGYKNDNGTIIAVDVYFKDGGGGEDDEVEVKGVVTAVGYNAFTVGGMQFNIVSGTKFIGMNPSGVEVGIIVAVSAEKKASGDYDALTVKLIKDTNDDPGSYSITGVLASVQSNGDEILELVLGDGTLLYADEDICLSGRHGLKSFAKDLIPGLSLFLKYKMSEGEAPRREVTHISIIGNSWVKGIISGANAASIEGTLMVGGSEVHWDNRTIVQGDTKVKDPAKLPNAVYVVVLANPLEDGTFLANRFIVTDNDDDDDLLGKKVKFYGTVSAVSVGSSLNSFSVGDQAFDVNGGTKFKVTGSDEPFDPVILEEGMSVKVLAVYDGTGYVAAKVSVILPIYRFAGPLEAISKKSLTMLGIDMSITDYTEFKDVKANELEAGDVVEVKAVLWPDGTMIACDVEPGDDIVAEFEVKGFISDKTVDGKNVLITVGGITIIVRPSGTSISTKHTTPTIDDLTIGMYVQVAGVINDAGDYLARHIKIQ